MILNRITRLKTSNQPKQEEAGGANIKDNQASEYAKLQSKYSEVRNENITLKMELSELQLEKQDLETQLKDISASITNKQNMSGHKENTQNVEYEGDKSVQDAMKSMEKSKDEVMKLMRKLEIILRTVPEHGRRIQPYTKGHKTNSKHDIHMDKNTCLYWKESLNRRFKRN